MNKIRDILNFGFKQIKKYKYGYLLYIILSLLISLIGVVIPLVLGQIIDLITRTSSEVKLEQLVGIFIILMITQYILSYITNLQYIKIQSEAGYMSNISSIEKIYKASYKEVCNINPSSLHQMINNDCNTIIIFCITLFKDLLVNIAIILFIFIITFRQSTVMSILFILLIVCYSIVYYIFKNKLYYQGLKVKNKQADFFGKLYNLLGNLKSIKINGFFSRTVAKQDSIFQSYKYELIQQTKLSNTFEFFTLTITIASQAFLYLYGGNMVLSRNMGIGMFVALANYFSKLLNSTDYFLHLGTQIQNVKSSYDRLMEYTNFEEYKYGNFDIHSIDSIYFHNVSFKYDNNTVFELTRRFEKGKIYWIKGSNGSGKSTFVNVLAGLFELDFDGSIFINNKPLKNINLSKMRFSHLSIVEQRPFILSESLNDNLLCKNKFKKIIKESDVEVESILKNLNIADIASFKNNGFNTPFDSLTDKISGGERQKIALARTFLSTADVWIFDEPTSALDENSRKNFYDLIKKYRNSKIIFIISHENLDLYDEVVNFKKIV